MLSLRETQSRFVDALLHEQVDSSPFIASGRFPAERHLQIYRNNVFESLTAALRAVFPAIEKLVGDGFFRYATHEYTVQHPPTSGNLHDFGHSFAAFLEAFPPAQQHEYLADVARLEWAWHEAFHAADAPALDPASLAAVPPAQYPSLRFQLHPSARLMASRFPVATIWEANIGNDAAPPAINLDSGPDRLLIIRRGLNVMVERLGEAEHALLEAMARNDSFGAACESVLACDPDFDLSRCLRDHVRRATLCGFTL